MKNNKKIKLMSDKEFKTFLIHILKERAKYTEDGFIDLSGVDFLKEGVHFNFSESTLTLSNFRKADLLFSDFTEAELDQSHFNGASLYNCFFNGANFLDASIDRFSLEDADLLNEQLYKEDHFEYEW